MKMSQKADWQGVYNARRLTQNRPGDSDNGDQQEDNWENLLNLLSSNK